MIKLLKGFDIRVRIMSAEASQILRYRDRQL